MGRPCYAEWMVMLNSASRFNSISEGVAVNPTYAQSVLIHWGRGTTDGEIIIECSDQKYFDGTWAELKRVAWSGENKQELYEHNGPCNFIRTRITKAVAGGTVTTKLQGLVG